MKYHLQKGVRFVVVPLLFTFTLLTILLVLRHSLLVKTPTSSYPKWTLEEERVFTHNGKAQYTINTLQDHNRFVTTFRDLEQPFLPVRTVYYDGTMLWNYNERDHSATPDLNYCNALLVAEARRDGIQAVRSRYNLPNWYDLEKDVTENRHRILTLHNPYAPRHFFRLNYPATLKYDKPVGLEIIAGQTCLIFESKPNPKDISRSVTKYWVEPRSSRVLRKEAIYYTPGSYPAHPSSDGERVTKIHFYDILPLSRFQLPPGTTAYIPLILSKIRLPSSVKRVPMTGQSAALGFAPRQPHERD